MPDGRTLVTFRNVNGGLGTYAWCGDLERELGYQIGVSQNLAGRGTLRPALGPTITSVDD
ncbi:MAG TPA: hypothetical protein VNG11_01695 [Chloroflexota bacterium]|nr:hypothetical protein [Chloroflexota bacterium]